MIRTVSSSGIGCLPVISLIACGGGSVGGEVAKATAGAAAEGLMSAFASFLADSSSWLVGHIAGLATLPAPDLNATWFTNALKPMKQMVELVLLPLLFAATIGAVLRQDLRRLGRVWGVGLPLATLAGVGGAAFANLALKATDEATNQVTHSLNLAALMGGIDLGAVQNGLPVLIGVMLLLLSILGAVLIWLELLVRSTAVYVAMFFMPLALATYVWPATAHVAKRCVEILVALILSKFVVFATLALGLAAASKGSSSDTALVGAGIMLVASFTPFVLMRLAPLAEVAVISHLEGMSRRPFRAAARATTAASTTGIPLVARVVSAIGTRGDAEGGGGAPSAVSQQRLTEHRPDYPIPPEGPDGS